jgi:riboflavin kinase/FMN adenylyltransferase
MLRSLGRELDFEVAIVPAVLQDGKRISSSQIRASLAVGDFASAATMLGRPFRMEGHVVRGAGMGRKLGYPTANLRIRSEPSPLGGVLSAFSRIGGGPWLPAVTNLGRRPAVGGREPLLEVHFFDFDEDIYGQRLEVEFVAKLRDELNFDSLDDLVTQMKQDELKARAQLAEARLPN